MEWSAPLQSGQRSDGPAGLSDMPSDNLIQKEWDFARPPSVIENDGCLQSPFAGRRRRKASFLQRLQVLQDGIFFFFGQVVRIEVTGVALAEPPGLEVTATVRV